MKRINEIVEWQDKQEWKNQPLVDLHAEILSKVVFINKHAK
jgi:hypothetical protein